MGKINYTDWLAQIDTDLAEALQNSRYWQDMATKLQQLKNAVSALNKPANLELATDPMAHILAMPTLQNLAGYSLTLPDDYGLTAATRALFGNNRDEWFSAAEVKERLDSQNFDWSSYTQPMAALHTVLNRLAVRELETQTGEGTKLFKKRAIPLPRNRKRASGSHYRPYLSTQAKEKTGEKE